MKKTYVKKLKPGVYIAAFLVIASSLLLMMLVAMTEMSLLFPRKVKLIVKTETLAKIYDGTPLVGENYYLIYGQLIPGHSIEVLSKSSQTELGQKENRMELVIRDSTGSDVTKSYQIEQSCGTLTVAIREVSICMANAQKTYDGTPLTSARWELVGPQGVAKEHTLHLVSTSEITEVGSTPNAGSAKVFDKHGNDVTKYYVLTIENGTLEIKPRPLTITTESASKLYDGMPISLDQWRLTSGTLAEGHRIDVSCTSRLTEVGKVGNHADIVIQDSNGADVTAQYAINVKEGELTVLPRTLYITTDSAEKVYDGTPLSGNWQITSGALDSGDVIRAIATTELTKVGQVENRMTFVIRDASGRDVTSRYDIQLTPGNLLVKPNRITIQTGSASKKYDGLPLKEDSFTIISGSLCAGENVSVVTETNRTNIGSTQNLPLSWSIYRTVNGVKTDVTDCYQITFSYGTLTITP